MPLPIPPTNRSGRLQTTRPRSPAASDDETIRRRGSAAMFYVLSWGFANLVITFFGSVVLARLLSPRDFGLIAVGQTVATLASTVAEGGIASGFIRQSEGIALSVLRVDQRISVRHHAGICGRADPNRTAVRPGGRSDRTDGVVDADCESADRGASRSGRELRFRAIAIVEAVGVLAYYAWAIAGVLAGYGVWSLASGTVVRAGMSTLAVGGIVSWRLLVPSLARYRDVLAVIGFGIRFSLFNLTNVLYDQGKNIVIATFGGTAALGLWVLADRLLQLPYLMYQPINRVAFPAFSQFIASGRDPRPVLERVVRLSFAASTLVLPAFLVAVPGVITSLFGAKWDDAALIFPGVDHLVLHRGPGRCRLHSVPVRRRSTV